MNDARVALFASHILERQQKTETVLSATEFNSLLVYSGTPLRYFADDQDAPFHTFPHFAHFVPLYEPGNFLLVRQGKKPLLIRVKPDDYWHEQAPLGEPFWLSQFEYSEVKSEDDAWKEIAPLITGKKIACIGEVHAFTSHGIDTSSINPTSVLSQLNVNRSIKTSYEVFCLEEANRIAAAGHKSAQEAFLRGESELNIHNAYMDAVNVVERELPYETIVALNEKGAILHYQGKRRDVRNGASLLLDAGASYLGYASDVTRTYVASHADSLFIELLQGVEKLQQELCVLVKPGFSFTDFQKETHLKIGNLLFTLGILTVDGKEAVELGLTKVFFPHGVGHMLGLQVHDVGGKQKPSEGETELSEKSPLRTDRTMEVGQVFTIEPGVYFIEMLLRPHRGGTLSVNFNWEHIDRLAQYGGVRIEDDVLVTENGIRNLTREYL
ncbi:MAG: Xaa-Pro dipeptidase [Patescibacteria group bacterium]